jgi:RNA-binding protein YlmH
LLRVPPVLVRVTVLFESGASFEVSVTTKFVDSLDKSEVLGALMVRAVGRAPVGGVVSLGGMIVAVAPALLNP